MNQYPLVFLDLILVVYEHTELEFPDYETAKAYTDEWIGILQEYLDEQSLVKQTLPTTR